MRPAPFQPARSRRRAPTFSDLVRCILFLAFLPTTVACVPPFSELHGARLVGTGRVEVTPSYSSVQSSGEGAGEVQTHIGMQVATGITDRADLRMRLERITIDDGDEDMHVYVVGAGPKLALAPDRLALYLPVGLAFGEGIEASSTFQAHPTLLATVQLARGLDLTGSTKALIPLSSGGGDVLMAFNVGLGLFEGVSPLVLRPEVGMLINPGEDGRFWHFSLGLSYRSGR